MSSVFNEYLIYMNILVDKRRDIMPSLWEWEGMNLTPYS
jgi:hypothetical protein